MSELEYCYAREKFIKNTLTVGELIDILNKYPKEMKVMITWESTVNELREEFIYEAKSGTLYLDGESGFYKEEFQK